MRRVSDANPLAQSAGKEVRRDGAFSQETCRQVARPGRE